MKPLQPAQTLTSPTPSQSTLMPPPSLSTPSNSQQKVSDLPPPPPPFPEVAEAPKTYVKALYDYTASGVRSPTGDQDIR